MVVSIKHGKFCLDIVKHFVARRMQGMGTGVVTRGCKSWSDQDSSQQLPPAMSPRPHQCLLINHQTRLDGICG